VPCASDSQLACISLSKSSFSGSDDTIKRPSYLAVHVGVEFLVQAGVVRSESFGKYLVKRLSGLEQTKIFRKLLPAPAVVGIH